MPVSGIIIGSLCLKMNRRPASRNLEYTIAALDHLIISFLQQVQLPTQNILYYQCLPEKLAEALGWEEFRCMEDCVLKKVGEPCCWFC